MQLTSGFDSNGNQAILPLVVRYRLIERIVQNV